MLNEFQIRYLREVLKENLNKSRSTLDVMKWSGGIAALDMVLEEEEK
jgi:hypothetical protein